MDIMEEWLSSTIRRDLGGAMDVAPEQQSDGLKGRCEDDGSNLRVKVSKPGVAQIIKVGARPRFEKVFVVLQAKDF